MVRATTSDTASRISHPTWWSIAATTSGSAAVVAAADGLVACQHRQAAPADFGDPGDIGRVVGEQVAMGHEGDAGDCRLVGDVDNGQGHGGGPFVRGGGRP